MKSLQIQIRLKMQDYDLIRIRNSNPRDSDDPKNVQEISDLTGGMVANLEAFPAVQHRAELGLPLLQLRHQFLPQNIKLLILMSI